MNSRTTALRLLYSAGACCALLLLSGASVQPGSGPGPSGQGERRGGTATLQPVDAEGLRQLIERRLEDHKQGIVRLEEARKKLAAGADPSIVGRELMEVLRERRGGTPRREGAGSDQPGIPPQSNEAGRPPRPLDLGGLFGGRSLSPEERARVRTTLREKHGVLLAKIEEFSGGDEALNDRLLDGVGGKLRWIEAMREKSPEESALRLTEIETGLDLMRLGREVTEAKRTNASPERIKAAREKLVEKMDVAFSNRQAISRLQVQQLKKRAEELETQLDKKESERSATVERQTEEFLGMLEGARVRREKD